MISKLESLSQEQASSQEELEGLASRRRFVRVFGKDVCEARPFYNFGAGGWRHSYFRNIDMVDPNYPTNQPDIVYDAFELLPFPIRSDSARLFYMSHVNEHLPDHYNRHVLSEVYRCLVPGGALRIVYPDFDVACCAYRRGDREFFVYDWRHGDAEAVARRLEYPMAQLLLDFFATRAQVGSPNDGNRKYTGDEFAELIEKLGTEDAAMTVTSEMSIAAQRKRPNTHINWWNHRKFEHILAELGFADITRSAYLQSRVPPLRDPHYFDAVLPHMSGYVEAFK